MAGRQDNTVRGSFRAHANCQRAMRRCESIFLGALALASAEVMDLGEQRVAGQMLCLDDVWNARGRKRLRRKGEITRMLTRHSSSPDIKIDAPGEIARTHSVSIINSLMIGHHFSISAFCSARRSSGVCRARGKS
jgi:hypothetical protein